MAMFIPECNWTILMDVIIWPAHLHQRKEALVFNNLEGMDTLWYPVNNFSPGYDCQVYLKKVETIHWLSFFLCMLTMPIADCPLSLSFECSCDCSSCSQGFDNTFTGCCRFAPARLDMFYQVPSQWAVRAIEEMLAFISTRLCSTCKDMRAAPLNILNIRQGLIEHIHRIGPLLHPLD